MGLFVVIGDSGAGGNELGGQSSDYKLSIHGRVRQPAGAPGMVPVSDIGRMREIVTAWGEGGDLTAFLYNSYSAKYLAKIMRMIVQENLM